MSRKKREQKDRAWQWRVGQVAAYAAVKFLFFMLGDGGE